MAKNNDNIEIEGTVIADCGDTKFRISELEMVSTDEEGNETFMPFGNDDSTILCHISGKIRKNNITITEGDRVRAEISPYDMTKGRITFRLSTANKSKSSGAKPKGKRRK